MTDQTADRTDTAPQAPYRVLARKYRPSNFSELIGQEALVRTLTNAINGGRLAHAFVLTGVRGVGKTTTARILAKALNCIGPDGSGQATAAPCGVCDHCKAIAEDRDVDVIEMDAASRTGVDDMRELLDGVRYRPVSARYKVYIIDEVHMLSTSAFNALLKTLEEPPEHVVFVFATTEIRKVPVTVLSRCQRFDLRRVDQVELVTHFQSLLAREKVSADDLAIAMIARAADGSVRDGLSLLDQAIALGGGKVESELVREMLGLADRSQIFDLLDHLMGGRIQEALAVMGDLHAKGADPAVVLQDLLELTHWLTRAKLIPQNATEAGLPEAERVRGRAMAEALSMPVLSRAWQILLKGLQETQFAPAALSAAEMVLIRLAHISDLPPPGDLVKRLMGQKDASGGTPGNTKGGPEGGSDAPRARLVSSGGGGAGLPQPQEAPQTSSESEPQSEDVPEPVAAPAPQAEIPKDFEAVAALCSRMKEPRLAALLVNEVNLVAFEPGRIEIRPSERAPRDLAGRLSRFLTEWTQMRWVVTVSGAAGEATLSEQRADAEAAERRQVLAEPLVRSVQELFPGAKLIAITGASLETEAVEEALSNLGLDDDLEVDPEALEAFLGDGEDLE